MLGFKQRGESTFYRGGDDAADKGANEEESFTTALERKSISLFSRRPTAVRLLGVDADGDLFLARSSPSSLLSSSFTRPSPCLTNTDFVGVGPTLSQFHSHSRRNFLDEVRASTKGIRLSTDKN